LAKISLQTADERTTAAILRPSGSATLALEAAINRLDRFNLLILDDLAYVTKDQAETSVLFELIGARYERRSTAITANQPFGAWGKVFPDPAMTLAAVDRLVHHATIFEINVDSYRRRAALDRKHNGAGRPQAYATINDLPAVSLPDNQTKTYRGRDARYQAPPAQIHASGFPARGSYLGCLTAKRTLGHG
jgi:hypothetical protein